MTTANPVEKKQEPETAAREAGPIVLEARNLYKNFGGIKAVDNVSLTLRKGEILGIVGDNGAGKSTLIKILTGAYKKDAGEVLLDGQPVDITTTGEARSLGIETVYQSSGLVELMNAPANLFLGRELRRKGFLGKLGLLDKRTMREETAKLLKLLNIEVRNLSAPMHTLSGGQQQSVAVGRAAYWKGKIIILDEPANNIGVDQQRAVLAQIRHVRDTMNIPFIMISHNMEHVFSVADRLIVMRNGQKVGDVNIKDISHNDAVAMITGLEL